MTLWEQPERVLEWRSGFNVGEMIERSWNPERSLKFRGLLAPECVR